MSKFRNYGKMDKFEVFEFNSKDNIVLMDRRIFSSIIKKVKAKVRAEVIKEMKGKK